MENIRKIIHIDMDAFYASVEVRDNPALKGKPIIVGGDPLKRGVVATCSYEARKYGIHSGMSCRTAQALCPDALFLHGNHDKYKHVSNQIREIFARYTDKIEPLALDEAFLDVTYNKCEQPYATLIAKEIKQTIKKELDLTASAGVSYNKFLAKVASDYQKPDGLTVIRPEQAQALLDALPIEKFFGVGKVTARDLRRIGIRKGEDLRRIELGYLTQLFNKRGKMLYDFARGIDEREVESFRERKSIGVETTFEKDIFLSSEAMEAHILELVEELYRRTSKRHLKAKTLTVKIKFEDFEQITRRMSCDKMIKTKDEMYEHTKEILKRITQNEKRIRLLGLTLSNLLDEDEIVFVNVSLFDK